MALFAPPRRRQSTFGTPQANPWDQSTQGFNFAHPMAASEGARLAGAIRPMLGRQPGGFQNLPYRPGTSNASVQNLPYGGGGNPQMSLFGGRLGLPIMAAQSLAGATIGSPSFAASRMTPQQPAPSLAQQRQEIGAMADSAQQRAQAAQYNLMRQRSFAPTTYGFGEGNPVPTIYPSPQPAGSGPYDSQLGGQRFFDLQGQQPAYTGPANVPLGTSYSGGSTVATMPSGNQGLMPPDALIRSQNAQRGLEASRRGLAFAPGATVGHRAPEGMVNAPGFPLPVTPEQRTNIINNSPRMQRARAFGQDTTGGREVPPPPVDTDDAGNQSYSPLTSEKGANWLSSTMDRMTPGQFASTIGTDKNPYSRDQLNEALLKVTSALDNPMDAYLFWPIARGLSGGKEATFQRLKKQQAYLQSALAQQGQPSLGGRTTNQPTFGGQPAPQPQSNTPWYKRGIRFTSEGIRFE